MNRSDAKDQLVKFLCTVIVQEAIRGGFDGDFEHVHAVSMVMLPKYVDVILERYVPNPMAITENMGRQILKEPQDNSAESLKKIVEWIVEDHGVRSVPSPVEIRKIVHSRYSSYSRAGKILLQESFFPFGKGYEP